MIAWLVPLALVGLAAVAGPVTVHLLRRHRARRIQFPSLRFLQPAQTAAVRPRLPDDAWLLLVRAAIVALAAMALAQPVFVTAMRRALWDARVARAIVVDSSASMAAAAAEARAAAEAETAAATFSVQVNAPAPGTALASAAASLQGFPPARREIVVISDFQQGSITAADTAAVHAAIGIRFVPVGRLPARAAFDGDALLTASGAAGLQQRIRLDGPATSVRLDAVPLALAGVRIVPADDRLLRIVGTAVAPAPSSEQPIVLIASGGSFPNLSPIGPGWMLRTVLRMQQDADLIAAAAQHERGDGTNGAPWSAVAFDGRGNPIVSAASAGTELIVRVGASPASFVAAAALRAALVGRVAREAWAEREVQTIDRTRLGTWSRAPGPVPPDAWRQSAPGDARWVWAAVLLLLGVEVAIRRSRPAVREVHADAA
jgi:hypothetical protein